MVEIQVHIFSVARKHCRKITKILHVSQESEFLQNQNKVTETRCVIMEIRGGWVLVDLMVGFVVVLGCLSHAS